MEGEQAMITLGAILLFLIFAWIANAVAAKWGPLAA